MSTVIAGNVNLTCANNSCPSNQQSRRITSVHIHPNYAQLSDYSNDIAVLKITPAFTVTQSVGPVDLYVSEDSESLSRFVNFRMVQSSQNVLNTTTYPKNFVLQALVQFQAGDLSVNPR